ncbi:MAG TPA: hypothetical protein VFV87_01525, partial [Pirellulaceae bacterium]|nr:hypothetical protein [Pirellulaceae bacterium]
GMYTQRLLNELSAARVTLLSPEAKKAYDDALARHLAARIVPASATQHTSQPAPAVLTFGLGQTPVVPAPPVLPPPPPASAAPRISLDDETDEEPPPEPAKPSPWWRPLAVLIAASILALAGVVGWGISKPYFDHLRADRTSAELPSDADQSPEPEPPPKPAPKPIVLLQEGSGEVVFTPATATRSGAVELQIALTEEVLANWTGPDDAAEWRFKLVKPGFFDVELSYATSAAAGEGAVEVTIGEREANIPLQPTGGIDQFHSESRPLIVPASGEHTLALRPKLQLEGHSIIVRGVRLVPALTNTLPAGEATPP